MAIRKIIKRATDSLFTNPEFDGTEAARQVKGTTAERASAEAGDLRFNTTTSLMEYYDGVQWKSIDAPPIVSSISPSNIADTDTSVDIVITGSNFSTSPTVTAIGTDASVITPTTVVRDSTTQITATFNGTDFSDAQEDYDIKVENISGLSNTLSDALAVNASPVWTVASGSLGSIYDSGRSGVSITTGATDDEGATLTYAVASGALPSGLSLNTSTGAISGTAAAVGSDTTSNFTLSVTDGTNTVTRAYSIEVLAPIVQSFTSTGSGTFSVPTGVTAVDTLVVAGGASSGADNGGGGGAGGLIYRPAFPVTPGGSVSYTVGDGGYWAPGPYYGNPLTSVGSIQAPTAWNGQNSVFGSLTAIGGGVGGTNESDGRPGGSGGGGSRYSPSQAGTGTQPQQPGDSGTYGFGNPGGNPTQPNPSAYGCGSGGGGAGQAGFQGGTGAQGFSGEGGDGKAYSISGSSVYYAGGGAGGQQSVNPGHVTAGGLGGGAPSGPATGDSAGVAAQANRGGGGGAGGGGGNENWGAGGSGVIIVSY